MRAWQSSFFQLFSWLGFIFCIIYIYLCQLFLQLPFIQNCMAKQSAFVALIMVYLLSICVSGRLRISDIIEKTSDPSKLIELRSQETAKKYKDHMQRLKANNISITNYIQDEKFGYDGESGSPIYFLHNTTYNQQVYSIYFLDLEQQDPTWIAKPINRQNKISGLTKDTQFLLLMVNQFPYDLDHDVSHWLIWSNRQIQLDLVLQVIKELKSDEYIHFAYVNPPNRKSVPQIDHAQIFIEKTLQSSESEL